MVDGSDEILLDIPALMQQILNHAITDAGEWIKAVQAAETLRIDATEHLTLGHVAALPSPRSFDIEDGKKIDLPGPDLVVICHTDDLDRVKNIVTLLRDGI